jgi:hypothetical protein
MISHRLFQCARCHSLVRICSSCDRGQRFCEFPCAGQARRESTRRANKKYRESIVQETVDVSRGKMSKLKPDGQDGKAIT